MKKIAVAIEELNFMKFNNHNHRAKLFFQFNTESGSVSGLMSKKIANSHFDLQTGNASLCPGKNNAYFLLCSLVMVASTYRKACKQHQRLAASMLEWGSLRKCRVGRNDETNLPKGLEKTSRLQASLEHQRHEN